MKAVYPSSPMRIDSIIRDVRRRPIAAADMGLVETMEVRRHEDLHRQARFTQNLRTMGRR